MERRLYAETIYRANNLKPEADDLSDFDPRYETVNSYATKNTLANYCRRSREDIRED